MVGPSLAELTLPARRRVRCIFVSNQQTTDSRLVGRRRAARAHFLQRTENSGPSHSATLILMAGLHPKLKRLIGRNATQGACRGRGIARKGRINRRSLAPVAARSEVVEARTRFARSRGRQRIPCLIWRPCILLCTCSFNSAHGMESSGRLPEDVQEERQYVDLLDRRGATAMQPPLEKQAWVCLDEGAGKCPDGGGGGGGVDLPCNGRVRAMTGRFKDRGPKGNRASGQSASGPIPSDGHPSLSHEAHQAQPRRRLGAADRSLRPTTSLLDVAAGQSSTMRNK